MNNRKIRFKRIFWWSLFGFWLILTVYLSSQNGSGSSDISNWIAEKLWCASNLVIKTLRDDGISYATFHFYVRKLAHFSVHFLLAFITIRASSWSFPKRNDALRFAWIFSICLALFDEAIQLVSPGRASMLLDAGINLAGVALGASISGRFGPQHKKSPQTS